MAAGTPRHVWVDGSAGGTLITAAKLNELEQDAADALVTANDAQPADADLTTIAALGATTAGALVTDGSGWIRKTYTQLKAALGLVKADVGLANVDNTTDAAKPVSTATQTALNAKAGLTHTHGVTDLTATGTKNATTFLRGDNTWAAPAGSGGGGLPVYDVVATYGADKTGAVEATTAIQNAINAASTAGGGIVYFPAGTYLLNAALSMKSKVTLKGPGLGAATIYQNSNTAAAVTAVDQHEMVIEDLTIYGTEAGTNTGILLTRTAQPDIHGLTFRRIQVGGFQTAIDTSNAITSTFDRVLVNTGQTGFSVHGVNGGSAGTSVTFLNCYAAGFTQSGYRIDTMAYCAFVGTACDDAGIAYEIVSAGTQGISFTGCGCETLRNTNTAYPGIGWKINSAVGVSLDGCFSYDLLNISILITGNAQAVKVSAFSENSPKVAVVNSIKVDAGSSAVLEAVATVKPLSLAAGTTSQIKVNGTSAL